MSNFLTSDRVAPRIDHCVRLLLDRQAPSYNLHQTPSRNPSAGRKVALYAIFRLSAIQ